MRERERPGVGSRAEAFARYIANPDTQQPGPFLWYLCEHLHGNSPVSQGAPQDEIAIAGRVCGNLLKTVGWLDTFDKGMQTSYLLKPYAKDGTVIGSWHMRALSAILSGASPGEILDRLRHHGAVASFQIIEAMRSEIDALVPFHAVVSVPNTTFSYESDHVYPYMDLARVPLEQSGVLFDAMNETLTGIMATYGGINADVLYATARQTDPPHLAATYEYEELCGPADEALGLRMPHAWYFNIRRPMETALYYNYLQTRKYWRRPEKNEVFRQSYGIVCLVECYDVGTLVHYTNVDGVERWSTPFDLMLTAEFIARGKPARLGADPAFLAFKDEILATAGYYSSLEELSPDDRFWTSIAIVRKYWESVLRHRGTDLNDQEIIANDPYGLLGDQGFSFLRRPSVVLIGGNADKRIPTEPEEEIVGRNIRLALMQYPPNTQLILPWYHDPREGGSPWMLSLHAEPKSDLTLDAFIVGLIGLEAMADLRTYEDMRTRYETLACQSGNVIYDRSI